MILPEMKLFFTIASGKPLFLEITKDDIFLPIRFSLDLIIFEKMK